LTLFEYLSAAHTLLLTFAAARMLAGVPHAVDLHRLFWVHLSWFCMAIMFCLTSFWALWLYREVEWTLPRLLVLLSTPALIYIFCCLLVPSDPSEVSCWREYFFRARVRIFTSGILLVLSVLVSNQFLVGVPPLHSSQIGLYCTLIVFALGAISSKPRLHHVLALAPPLAISWILLTETARPDWVAP